MATFLNGIQLLQDVGFYAVVFPLLLILVILYAMLQKIQLFGDNKSLNALISFVIAMIFVSFQEAVSFINQFIPYIIVFGIILLLLMMLFMFVGAKDKDIAEAIKLPSVTYIIIGIILLVVVVLINQNMPSLDSTPDANNLATGAGDITGEGYFTNADVLFHPTTIGIIVMFGIFAVTAYAITSDKSQ